MTEAKIQQEIMAALGRSPACRIWRQNVGKFRAADDPTRWVNAGPPKGAGDISGILRDGRRLEIECKTATGRQSPDQIAFQRMIESWGGVYVLARSAAEAVEAVERALMP